MDLGQVIGAVTREVGGREYEGKPARVIVAKRTYNTSPDDLWDAISSAERIPRWFLPISGDLRLGGRYQLKGNAGGTITRCEPPKALDVTWEYGGETSWVSVRLTRRAADRTELELEHIAHVSDDRWNQFGPGAVGVGWDMTLMGLGEHVENASKPAVKPEDALAWMASKEGREFMRESSEGWGRASIAAGTPEDAARAAVERTTAAYTGSDGESGQ
jgi:uncharacterized protein YndB with AHSA1/START domain